MINSIILIVLTVMVESGLGGLFWFKAAHAGCEARMLPIRNTLELLLGYRCTVRQEIYLVSAHLGAGHGYI